LVVCLATRTGDDLPTVDCSDGNVVDSSSSPIGSSGESGRTPRRRILRGVARGEAQGEARVEARGVGVVRGGLLGEEERGA
jgi:hypothetical protein